MRRVSVLRTLQHGTAIWSAGMAATVGCAVWTAPADAARRPRLYGTAALETVRGTPTAPATRATHPVSSTSEPLLGVVSINRQSVTFYRGTERIAEAPISSGQPGHRTPTGVFSILQKSRYHESNIYSGAPMPFMQRLTWSGIALHAGNLPGYPASHGCIRLPYEFAERLFGLTKQGVRVVVAPDAAVPMSIVHDALPKPRFTDVTVPAAESATRSPVAATAQPMALTSALLPAAASVEAPATPAKALRLNPRQVAEHEKRQSTEAVIETQQVATASLQVSQDASADAETAKVDVRAAEATVARFRQLVRQARAIADAAQADEDRMQASASLSVAEEGLDEAVSVLQASLKAENSAADRALAMAVAARQAEDEAIRAAEAAQVAARGTEPVSVFVSRKENRVYVRQGQTPLIEGDVTIAEASAPIGTHVFTVVAANEGSETVGWSVITIPETGQPRLPASAALDRVTVEPKLAAEIARRLWTGATLIVSDHGISSETGKGTDFVILTR